MVMSSFQKPYHRHSFLPVSRLSQDLPVHSHQGVRPYYYRPDIRPFFPDAFIDLLRFALCEKLHPAFRIRLRHMLIRPGGHYKKLQPHLPQKLSAAR